MGRNALDLILSTFRLQGEEVVRIRTGKVVRPPARKPAVIFVQWKPGGGQINMLYHRVKFALVQGGLPRTVDHRNIDHFDNTKSNLRAATHAQQLRNRRPLRMGLPRGVNPYGKNGKFYAKVTHEGKQLYLGSFASPDEASAVVEAKLRELHGEFYRPLQA